MKFLVLVLLGFGTTDFTAIYAQGCSDAGFCTIGSIKPRGIDSLSVKNEKLTVFFANGIGDENVYVFTPGIQYDKKFNRRWAVQAKITANYTSGNLGNAFGGGDVFLSGTYTPKVKGKWVKSYLLGTKLPLNKSDIRYGDKPLPMQYQSSLGTIDLIVGFTITNNRLFFATAIQQPLTGRNGNTFLPVYWNTPEADAYPPSNDFNRKGDILARVGYDIIRNNKLTLNAGLLGIYHLGEDTYIDGNESSKPIALIGSEGLTLNCTASAWYRIHSKFSVGLLGGVPFVVRDVRPDGLTRKFVFTPEIIFHF